MSYALIAGLSYTEAQDMKPGMIMDLFLAKRNYDDQQHGIKRERC